MLYEKARGPSWSWEFPSPQKEADLVPGPPANEPHWWDDGRECGDYSRRFQDIRTFHISGFTCPSLWTWGSFAQERTEPKEGRRAGPKGSSGWSCLSSLNLTQRRGEGAGVCLHQPRFMGPRDKPS